MEDASTSSPVIVADLDSETVKTRTSRRQPTHTDVEIHVEPQRQSVRRPAIVWVLLAVIVGGAIFGCLFALGYAPLQKRKAMLTRESDDEKTTAPKVSVVTIKRAPAARDVVLPGDIQAVRETTIHARTNGYLKDWKFDIGDSVKAGQTLAEIETPEVEMELAHAKAAVLQAEASLEQTQAARMQAKANLEQAQATLEQSKATLEQAKAKVDNSKASEELAEITMARYEKMRGTPYISEQDLSERETAVKVAKAATAADKAAVGAAQAAVGASQSAVGAAQAAIGAAEANIKASAANVTAAKSNVDRQEVMKSFQTITAPFDGVIMSRPMEAGALVEAGGGNDTPALFRLAATDPVRVYINVPQMYAPLVKKGQTVNLLLREYPGATFKGEVTRTTGALDATSRTLRTEIQVPNKDGRLLVGMYTQVKLSVEQVAPPLLLPNSALVVGSDGTRVAVIRDGKIHYQPVVVDGDYGANIAISGGLTETDQIVTNPSERLVEGAEVTVTKAAEKK